MTGVRVLENLLPAGTAPHGHARISDSPQGGRTDRWIHVWDTEAASSEEQSGQRPAERCRRTQMRKVLFGLNAGTKNGRPTT